MSLPSPTTPARRRPTLLLAVLAVLLVGFVVSLIVVIAVAKPPSYDPVPVPSVSQT